MTQHDHRSFVDGCYRCDLSEDESGQAPEAVYETVEKALGHELMSGNCYGDGCEWRADVDNYDLVIQQHRAHVADVVVDAVWPLAVAHATRDEAAIGAEVLRQAAAGVELQFHAHDVWGFLHDMANRLDADSLAPVGTPSGNDTGRYEPCVNDTEGRCTRSSHRHGDAPGVTRHHRVDRWDGTYCACDRDRPCPGAADADDTRSPDA